MRYTRIRTALRVKYIDPSPRRVSSRAIGEEGATTSPAGAGRITDREAGGAKMVRGEQQKEAANDSE